MKENTEKRQVHVSILGSCVCRDALSLSKQAKGYVDAGVEFVVDRFVQSINPLSAISSPVPAPLADALIEESLPSATSNFYKRNFKLDVTKGWADYLCEAYSEWLLIDLSPTRLAMRTIGETYVTYELEMKVIGGLPTVAPGSALDALRSGEQLGLYDLSDGEIRDAVKAYLDRILTLYPEERIIVLDIRHLYTYVDPVRERIVTSNAINDKRYRRDDRVITVAYDFAKQYLPHAHFIDALPLLVGNVNHVWGKMGLHYVDEIYLYLLRAIERITDGAPSEKPLPARCKLPLRRKRLSRKKQRARREEREDLAVIYEEFSKKIIREYSAIVNRSAQEAGNLLRPENGVTVGVYEKNGLTLTIHPSYEFSICGTAEEDTVFYLYSQSKSPNGAWQSVQLDLPAGLYLFTTETETIPDRFFVQLVLTYGDKKQKWYPVDVATYFRTDTPCPYLLARIIVKKGTCVDARGKTILERIS